MDEEKGATYKQVCEKIRKEIRYYVAIEGEDQDVNHGGEALCGLNDEKVKAGIDKNWCKIGQRNTKLQYYYNNRIAERTGVRSTGISKSNYQVNSRQRAVGKKQTLEWKKQKPRCPAGNQYGRD